MNIIIGISFLIFVLVIFILFNYKVFYGIKVMGVLVFVVCVFFFVEVF